MKNLFETIRRWHRRNATIAELSSLDDHLLADIGITRGNLSEVARRLR